MSKSTKTSDVKKKLGKPSLKPREVTEKPVGKLVFDTLNPRLPSYLNKGSETDVIQWMLDEANIVELMGAIGEQGYFEGEPLIVVETKANKGVFEVVEGNRRLAAVKLLSHPELAPTHKNAVATASAQAKHKPTDIPVLVFDERSEVLRYLAYRHITGVEQWNPLQKARYLKQLANEPDFKKLGKDELRQRLAKEIGSNANYVARLLAGLAVYAKIADQGFFKIPGLDERTISYSVLTTALTYSSLARHIGLDSPTDDDAAKIKLKGLEELAKWVFEENTEGFTRVGESRGLKKLARIVETDKALQKFRDGRSLDEAFAFTTGPAEAFRDALRQGKSQLEIARDTVHLIDNHQQEDADLLKEIQRITRLVSGHVEDSLANSTKKSTDAK